MRSLTRFTFLGLALALSLAAPLAGQQPTVVADLVNDINDVESKLMQLARAIPADKYDWRPGAGVRSVGEVFKHVAADNWLLASAAGSPAPSTTGIRHEDYNTAGAYEKRQLSRDAIITELEQSLAHFKAAVSGTPSSKLGGK
ncbi:MAG TPA: DinB family protein, partial [Gemmatimonadales bacterium]|nr:DinB family protein [Gemmatimonadales bacterium]